MNSVHFFSKWNLLITEIKCVLKIYKHKPHLFFLSRKKPKLTLTDYVIKLDVKAQKVKCQISHIIFVI